VLVNGVVASGFRVEGLGMKDEQLHKRKFCQLTLQVLHVESTHVCPSLWQPKGLSDVCQKKREKEEEVVEMVQENDKAVRSCAGCLWSNGRHSNWRAAISTAGENWFPKGKTMTSEELTAPNGEIGSES
jgi:hypothetical protein